MFELFESTVYEFEDFRLDAKSHKLYRRNTGEMVPLTPKAVEVLLYFVRNTGRTVAKDELLDAVWGDAVVEESNLSQTIFVLRKALGENTKEPRFILTSPGRGYQFIADVREINPEDKILDESELSGAYTGNDQHHSIDSQRKQQSIDKRSLGWLLLALPVISMLAFGAYWLLRTQPPAALTEIRTIAILPFEDLSVEQKDKYLGVSLADALVNKFSVLKKITVRPTRSVLKYTDSREELSKIGRELQVEAIMDGRVQRVGERIRVNVQLIRVADNSTIWTGNFDDQFTNFFAVQDSISQQIARSLAIQIEEKERERFARKGTENVLAYQEYLLGRFFWNKRTASDLDRAIEHFGRSIELDGNFALAHAGLAETYAIYPFYAVDQDKESLPKARVAATRALEIDGELAEAHTVLAYVQSQYDFDWKAAESSYLRAIELNPNHANTRQWYGEFLVFQARYDESLVQMQKAIELDPTSLSANTAPALAYNASRQFSKALEITDRVLQMDANFLIARHYRSRALFFSGERNAGLAESVKLVNDSNGIVHFKADLGFFHGKVGNVDAARQILSELTETAKQKYVSPCHIAQVYIGMGEKEKAFELLEKAVSEHDNNVIVMKVGLNFDVVRDDPRFTKILRSANF